MADAIRQDLALQGFAHGNVEKIVWRARPFLEAKLHAPTERVSKDHLVQRPPDLPTGKSWPLRCMPAMRSPPSLQAFSSPASSSTWRSAASRRVRPCRPGVRRAENSREILRGLSFAVEPGHVRALLGRNGEDRSTVIRLLLGFPRPQAGEARLRGERSRGPSPPQPRARPAQRSRPGGLVGAARADPRALRCPARRARAHLEYGDAPAPKRGFLGHDECGHGRARERVRQGRPGLRHGDGRLR